MSTTTSVREAETGASQDDDIEARARTMGWRPKEEYKGPGEWRDAAEFVARGETDLRLLRQNNRDLSRKIHEITNQHKETLDVLQDVSERVRTSDERGYRRAKAELMKEREAAVEAGDTAAFRQREADLAELEASKPKPAPVAKPAADPNQPHPEAVAWAERNPWYRTDSDMRDKAQRIHTGLLAAEPGLSLVENLERVTETMRDLYPAKFRAAPKPAAADEEVDDMEDSNARRREAPAVSGSSPSGGSRRPAKNSFAAMPQDSKDAFVKYKRQVEGKPGSAPLTEVEWAKTYWAQFAE